MLTYLFGIPFFGVKGKTLVDMPYNVKKGVVLGRSRKSRSYFNATNGLNLASSCNKVTEL